MRRAPDLPVCAWRFRRVPAQQVWRRVRPSVDSCPQYRAGEHFVPHAHRWPTSGAGSLHQLLRDQWEPIGSTTMMENEPGIIGGLLRGLAAVESAGISPNFAVAR